jgi:hypothetical protein
MDDNASFTLASWNFSLLRMTAFPVPTHNYEAKVDEWWKEIIGEYPDTISQNPKVGLSHAKGTVKYGVLIIENQPLRIDVVMRQKDPDLSPTNVPDLISSIDALEYFQSIAQKWLNLTGGPVLSRLAFGAKLIHPVGGKEDGYKLLQKYLHHIKIDPFNSSDLLYRINRPRPSKTTSNIIINRLSTWTVERNVVVLIPIVGDQIVNQQQVSTNCSLELDINNKPEFPLNSTNATSVGTFEELIALGKEIAVAGDVE